MKGKIVFFLGVLVFLFGVIQVNAEVFKFLVSDDAWVNQANPSSNYGNATYLSVKDTSKLAEAYLKFNPQDLATLNGYNIVSTTLYLYQYQGSYPSGDSINIHSVSQDWKESEITWDNKPAYEPELISSLTLSDGVELWRSWSGLDEIIASWQKGKNFGLVLENNNDLKNEELFSRFYSSEYSDITKRPFLEVLAQPVPEPVSFALCLLGSGLLGLRRLKKRSS